MTPHDWYKDPRSGSNGVPELADVLFKDPIDLGIFPSGHNWHALTRQVYNTGFHLNERMVRCSRCLTKTWKRATDDGIIEGAVDNCDKVIIREVMES